MAGRKSIISDIKINAVFDLIRKNKFKKIVSRVLGMDVQTIDLWLKNGEEILKEQQDIYDQIIDKYLENKIQIEYIFGEDKEEYIGKFLQKNGYEEFDPKTMSFKFDKYIREEKIWLFESICKKNEEELINKTIFDEDKYENEKKQQYAKFFRAFTRGEMAITLWLQENIDEHASSSKNVQYSWKMLERMESECYSEQPKQVNHEHTHSLSLVDMAREFKKIQLEQQNKQEQLTDDIIDVEYEKKEE